MTRNMNRGGPSPFTLLLTAAAVTRNWQSVGPSRFKFLVTAVVVTRNFNQLGPRRAEFIVTTAVVTRTNRWAQRHARIFFRSVCVCLFVDIMFDYFGRKTYRYIYASATI